MPFLEQEKSMEYSYNEIFTRSIRLIGEDAQERLHHAHAAVFGLGGVGSHTAEALARAGLGTLTLIDKDVVDISNINRQAIALTTTVGRSKTEVMAERIRQIHPQITLYSHKFFFLKPEDGAILSPQPDFIIDAIDNVTGKLALAEYAEKSRDSDDHVSGNRKQIGSRPVSDHGYLSHLGLPACKGHAKRTPLP